jgi:hypothetical protein
MMKGNFSAEAGCGSEESPHTEVSGVCLLQRSASSVCLLVEQLQDGALPTRSGGARSTACVERCRSTAFTAAGCCHSLAWRRACSTLPKHGSIIAVFIGP